MVADVAHGADVANLLPDERFADVREGLGTQQPVSRRGRYSATGLPRGRGRLGAAIEQSADALGRAAREPGGEQVAIETSHHMVDLGKRVDRLDQVAAVIEARKVTEPAAGVEQEHRSHALLAAAAVGLAGHIVPADAEMPLHERIVADRPDFLEPRHRWRHVFDGERRRAEQRVGAGSRADVGVLEAEAIARDQHSAYVGREHMTHGGQRRPKLPSPWRRPDQRVAAEIAPHDHALCPDRGRHVAEESLDGGQPRSVTQAHVIAGNVDERIDPSAAGEERVEGVDPAAEAEGRGARGRGGVLRSAHQRCRRVRIPELAEGGGEQFEVGRPGGADGATDYQRLVGVHRGHEQGRAESLGCRGERRVGRLKPHRPSGRGRRHAVTRAAGADPRRFTADCLQVTVPCCRERPHASGCVAARGRCRKVWKEDRFRTFVELHEAVDASHGPRMERLEVVEVSRARVVAGEARCRWMPKMDRRRRQED